MTASTTPLEPYQWSETAISFSRADQWLNFDHPGKYPLFMSPVIRDGRVKKVLIDGGASINILFPKTLLCLGIPLSSLQTSDSPFFGIMLGDGEYPLGHITLPITFGTPEDFRTENLRFEVASFDYSYNAIIGQPGLAKFMAIPHYTYLVLKMSSPGSVLSLRGGL